MKKGQQVPAELRARMSAFWTGRKRQPHSPETRAKMSATKKGVPKSPAHRAALSAAKTGVPWSAAMRAKLGTRTTSPETAAKISVANTGKRASDETRAKLSKALKGRVISIKHRAKVSAAKMGQHPSDETRLKMSMSGRGTTKSPEHRAKMSAGMKAGFASGKIARKSASVETRAKISESGKRVWASGERVVSPAVLRYTPLAQALHAHLSATGLTLEPEVKFGRFTVDLYDREHHTAYEADGKYWHDKKEAREPGAGAARDEYLIQFYSLKVVHFTDKEISALTGYRSGRKSVA